MMIFGVNYDYVMLYDIFESNHSDLDVIWLGLNEVFMVMRDLSVFMNQCGHLD